jgi:hypothetical protein
MSLTTITGSIPTLAQNGRIIVIALSTITDGSIIYPKGSIISNSPIGFNGDFTLAVPDTEPTGQRVQIRIERGLSDPRELIDVIERVIPTASPQTLSSLIDSYYAPSLLDSSNLAISRLLAINPTFLASVPGFNEITWTTSQNFKLGDYTWRGDGLFRWISITQGSNKDPMIAANVLPSAGAVWERKITIPAPPNVISKAYDQAAFELLPTEGASRKNLNELRTAIGAVNSGALPTPIFWGRRSADVTAAANAFAVIDWDNNIEGADTAGTISIPTGGRYLALLQANIRMQSTVNNSGGRINARCSIFQNNIENGDFFELSNIEWEAAYDQKVMGVRAFTANAGDTVNVRFAWRTLAGAAGTASSRLVGGIAQNMLMIFRLG